MVPDDVLVLPHDHHPAGPSVNRPRRLVRKLAWGAAAMAVAGLVALGISHDWWQTIENAIGSAEQIRDRVERLGAWGPVAFVIGQMVQVVVVPIPGAVFPPAGALAFGPWAALLLSLMGMAAGSAVVFAVTRRWGRPIAQRIAGDERIRRYESLIESHRNLFLWLVFLLPLLPDDAVCAVAGLSTIRFRRFLLIATVGRLPAVAAGVFATAGLESAPPLVWLGAAACFAAVAWLGVRLAPTVERRWSAWASMRKSADRGGQRPAPDGIDLDRRLPVHTVWGSLALVSVALIPAILGSDAAWGATLGLIVFLVLGS